MFECVMQRVFGSSKGIVVVRTQNRREMVGVGSGSSSRCVGGWEFGDGITRVGGRDQEA